MRIKELKINGFGRFNEKIFGPLTAPIIVFYGPNEAGKSTLLNFIRTILFGFPKTNRDDHYPPVLGGKHGGRIIVQDGQGVEYSIERYVGPKGGQVTVSNKSGQVVQASKLNDLLGYSSKDVFEKIFAFSLDELQSSDILDDKNINIQIYSAGMGAIKLPSLIDKINSRMNDLYKPSGLKPKVNQLSDDLGKIEQQIRDITRNTDQYTILKIKAENADRYGFESSIRKDKLQKRFTRLSSMKEAWKPWVELKGLEKRLNELPVHEGLPTEPFGELEKREVAVAVTRKEFDAAREELDVAKIDAESIQPSERILADEEAIENINQSKSSVLNSLKDLPERKAELSHLYSAVDSTLTALGDGWNRERLQTTDLESLPVGTEIERYRKLVSGKSQKILNQESSLETHNNSLKLDEDNLLSAQRALSSGKKPEYSQIELDSKFKTIAQLEKMHNQYQITEKIQARLMNAKPQESIGTNSTNSFIATLTLATIGLIFAGYGFVAGQDSMFTLGLGSILIIIAGALFIYSRNIARNTSSDDQVSPVLLKGVEELKDIHNNLSTALMDLGLPSDGINRLPKFKIECETIRAQIASWEKLGDNIAVVEQQTIKQRSLAKSVEEALGNSKLELRDLENQWKNWLIEKHLPSTLPLETMDGYRARITTGKKELEAALTMASRITSIEEDIHQYSSVVVPLAKRHGEKTDSDNDNSLITVSESLVKKLEESRDLRSRKIQLAVDVEKYKIGLIKRKEDLQNAEEMLTSLLDQTKSADTEELRLKAMEHAEKKELITRKNKHVNALQVLSGPDEQYELFKVELQSANIAAIELELNEIADQLNEETDMHTKLVQQSAEANFAIKQLFDEDELSTLHVRRSQIQAELYESTRAWTRYRLAIELLNKGRDRFQRERQPGVIKYGEKFFREITKERYTGFYSSLGERTITVIDSSDERKFPSQLSRGTRELLFLSLRFGLINEYNQYSESLPVVVDEVLVNFDPERMERSCDAFRRLSQTNQLIVFTCHPEIVNSFNGSGFDTQVFNLGD